MSRRDNWQEFKRVLDAHGIKRLYHFTDSRNLQSIQENGGLLSLRQIEERGISSFTGGSDSSHSLDRGLNLDNYVRLSFVKDHPMMHVAQYDGRITNPKVLEISTEVIFEEGVKFTDCNAARTSKGFEIGDDIDFFRNKIHFDLFHKNYFDTDKSPYYQAEVLVPQTVSLSYVLNRSALGLNYTPPADRPTRSWIRPWTLFKSEPTAEKKAAKAAIDWAKSSIGLKASRTLLHKDRGEKATLSWATPPEEHKPHIHSIRLYEGDNYIGSEATTVSPSKTTAYTLKIEVADEVVEHTVRIRVEPDAIIRSFTCDRAKALPGTEVTLHWEVEGAQWLYVERKVSNGVSYGETLSGFEKTMEKTVTEDSTFILRAHDAFGGKEQSLQVRVLPQETIDKISHSLRASKAKLRLGKNETSAISWDVSTGDPDFSVEAKLTDSHGKTFSTSELGSVAISPRNSETYTLSVSVEGQDLPTQSVTVSVFPEAEVSFTSDFDYAVRGSDVTLSWDVKNANQVSLNGKAKEHSCSEKVKMEADTTFTLSVTDEFETTEHTVRVRTLAVPLIAEVRPRKPVVNVNLNMTAKADIIDRYKHKVIRIDLDKGLLRQAKLTNQVDIADQELAHKINNLKLGKSLWSRLLKHIKQTISKN